MPSELSGAGSRIDVWNLTWHSRCRAATIRNKCIGKQKQKSIHYVHVDKIIIFMIRLCIGLDTLKCGRLLLV